jgi:hypothetical protein
MSPLNGTFIPYLLRIMVHWARRSRSAKVL